MISVNKELCIGCGACAALCPDVFQIDADGKSEVYAQGNIECANNAVAGCPVQAIIVE